MKVPCFNSADDLGRTLTGLPLPGPFTKGKGPPNLGSSAFVYQFGYCAGGDGRAANERHEMTRAKKWKTKVRAKAGDAGMSYAATRQILAARAEPKEPEGLGVGYASRREAFRTKSLDDWRRLVSRLGRNQEWRGLTEIVDVLKDVAIEAPNNHSHFPDGGGLDLTGAEVAAEEGCIAVDFQGSHVICRPEFLQLVSFERDPLLEWSYLRLELCRLDATERSKGSEYVELYGAEPLVEVEPGRYDDRDQWERHLDGDIQLPSEARPVKRYLHGSFLIVPKGSTYNANFRIYDGEHAKMTATQFESYMAKYLSSTHEHGKYGVDSRAG